MVRVGARAAAGLALAVLAGCATVRVSGPDALADAGDQRVIAALLDAAVDQVQTEVGALPLRIQVTPADAFFSRYARLRLENGVHARGGTVAAEAASTLTLEIQVAGRERAERNLVLPLGQYVRLPLYYGQDDRGALKATLRLEDPGGVRTWELSQAEERRASYLFRVFGPF